MGNIPLKIISVCLFFFFLKFSVITVLTDIAASFLHLMGLHVIYFLNQSGNLAEQFMLPCAFSIRAYKFFQA
ncbi:hypothetical protein C2G38_2094956 [Gigaspora rosea]|uniref:Uncharacterized protein n=1 Tax=Gigaspora rosea TaxID=44941 RepID=A0A397UYE9_9GLOM|nr:hypothetical protein C2G38_2094956 [Gigaspora rosea]